MNSLSRANLRIHFWASLSLALAAAWLVGCGLLASTPAPPGGAPLPTSQPHGERPATMEVTLATEFNKNPNRVPPDITGFGETVGLSGDTFVVGASNWHGMEDNRPGHAIVFQRSAEGWVEQQILTSSDHDDGFQYNQQFGKAVAIDGDTLVVGAPTADDPEAGDNTGAVYVFERRGDQWEETAILKPAEASAQLNFGSKVALQAGTLLAAGGFEAKALYVFEREGDSWVERARLEVGDLGERDLFPWALAIHGDWFAASAWLVEGEDPSRTTGTVHLYRRGPGGWQPAGQLSSGKSSWDAFGGSLALAEGILVVGVSGDMSAGMMAGAAYVYRLSGERWIDPVKLVPGDGEMQSAFGSAAAIHGDLLAVGAGGDSTMGLWSGSAYVFRRQGEAWQEQLKLVPYGEHTLGAFFGSQLALEGNTLVVGAPNEFGNAAFVYELRTSD